ncbi:MAG: DUF1348 family protein [Woeseiaceae bacterium]|nr:DUF1348 family protein [Woeseiaceae bacterium]
MHEAPENSTIAIDFARSIEKACISRNPSEIVRHLARQAVWRDDDTVYVGRDEIWKALNAKWALSLLCTTAHRIELSDSENIKLVLDAEWQHSRSGRWYCTRAVVQVTLDDQSHVATVESRNTIAPISASERRLTIPMATSFESTR